jgi:hypothetical protein
MRDVAPSFSHIGPDRPEGIAPGKIVHPAVVTIDNRETILRFESKEDAERFAQEERARLAGVEKNASARVREIAYRLWQEEGGPEGEALRHWFAPKAISCLPAI